MNLLYALDEKLLFHIQEDGFFDFGHVKLN